MATTCAPATGCVCSRRESRRSAAGQLEQPSLVNNSTTTGTGRSAGSASGAQITKARRPRQRISIAYYLINLLAAGVGIRRTELPLRVPDRTVSAPGILV